MADGSTALILAARLAVEGMVEELIASHADVNAVDELGRLRGVAVGVGSDSVTGTLTWCELTSTLRPDQ